jgi:O-antigen ligase
MRLTPAGGAPALGSRIALRLLQLGLVTVVLAAATQKEFELDRFFVPKELTLHLTAFLAGIVAIGAFRRVAFTRIDALLTGYLVLGVVSALFATNGWLAARALAISVSGVAVFWVARAVRDAGLARPLLRFIAMAVVVGAVLALLQAYGVRTDLFSENRAPGGTLGNRNFIAHMAAFGLPVVMLSALRAWRGAGFALGALGMMLVVASLVLTRSRAGWVAFAAVMLVFIFAMVASRALRRHRRTWLRLSVILLLMTGGAAAAVLLPNSLRWRSDNPYLESVRGVANYQEGSGQGRLIQYRRSMGMLAASPVLGAGPGNWAVEYPRHAAPGDPSLSGGQPGTTSNPWPSSDWVAFLSERGVPGALVLGLALLGLAAGGLRRLVGARDDDEALVAATLLATVVAVVVAGLFDAVLLLALPTMLVWASLGALWSPADSSLDPPPSNLSGMLLLTVALLSGAGAVRGAGQLVAMNIYASQPTIAGLERAATLDPGNYRVHLRIAQRSQGANRDRRCRHAAAAHALYPNARAAQDLRRGCGN